MSTILYHPLVDQDSSGTDKIPMFPTDKFDVISENHSMWLREIIKGNYWLMSKAPMNAEDAARLDIHCPCCGKVMRPFTSVMDEHQLSLYRCEECSRKENENGESIQVSE